MQRGGHLKWKRGSNTFNPNHREDEQPNEIINKREHVVPGISTSRPKPSPLRGWASRMASARERGFRTPLGYGQEGGSSARFPSKSGQQNHFRSPNSSRPWPGNSYLNSSPGMRGWDPTSSTSSNQPTIFHHPVNNMSEINQGQLTPVASPSKTNQPPARPGLLITCN
jgi:hypothetical protein